MTKPKKRCSYAGKYKGLRKPSCGCSTCKTKYRRQKVYKKWKVFIQDKKGKLHGIMLHTPFGGTYKYMKYSKRWKREKYVSICESGFHCYGEKKTAIKLAANIRTLSYRHAVVKPIEVKGQYQTNIENKECWEYMRLI